MNFKRAVIFIASAIAIGTSVISSPVYAHEIKSAGPIHVVFHVDPNDTPVPNEQSILNFYIFDDEGKFLGTYCNCTIKVTLRSEVLLNRSIVVTDNFFNHVATLPFIFPLPGSYQIYFIGTPKNGHIFHKFNLSYTLLVKPASKSSYSNTPYFIGAALLGLAIFGITIFALSEFKDV